LKIACNYICEEITNTQSVAGWVVVHIWVAVIYGKHIFDIINIKGGVERKNRYVGIFCV
jgi:hypothetical protein